MMTELVARRRYAALKRMTTARGCTPAEAATAARLAGVLAIRYGLEDSPAAGQWRADFATRFARAERHAAIRFHWEYRHCGKRRCWCARRGAKGHGPYRYTKRRTGTTVRSIYWGR